MFSHVLALLLACRHNTDTRRALQTPNHKAEYDLIGKAIANSSNPNMVFGVWNSGNQHVWKWAANAGGHYWRMAGDIYNGWSSVMRQFDTVGVLPAPRYRSPLTLASYTHRFHPATIPLTSLTL